MPPEKNGGTKMKEDKVFTLALCWIIGGLAAVAICYMLGCFLGIKSTDAPSWIQAIGSVGAIVFAWFMSAHHQRLQEKERRKDELRKLIQTAELCEAFVNDCRSVLRSVREKFRGSCAREKWSEIGTERLLGLLSAIDSLFAKDIPPGLFSAMLPVQREVAYTLTAVRQYNANQIAAKQARGKKAMSRLKVVRKAHDEIKAILLLHRMEWVEATK